MDKDLISINIITKNNGAFLKQAIESVLNQSYKNIEIIIINDGSTDNTEEIIRSFNSPLIKYYKNSTNIKIPKARNLGIEKSNGEFIAILDGDDFWNDNFKLEKQLRFLKENLDHALVGTFVKKNNELGKDIGNFVYETDNLSIRKKLLLRNQFTQSSILIRKDIIEKFKYDESLNVWEDYDLWLRIGEKYKFANLKDFSTSYRIHSRNISKEYKKKGNKILYSIIKRNSKKYPNFYLAYIKHIIRIINNYIF